MADLLPQPPNPNYRPNITCETKGSNKFRVSMEQGKIRINIPKISLKKACKTQKQDVENGDRNVNNKMRKKGRGKLFPVKKVSSVISSVLGHKKTQVDDSRKTESAEADQTLAIVSLKTDQKPSKMAKSLRKIKRVSSSILVSGWRMRTGGESTREKVREEVEGEDKSGNEEEELCKKRILMGGKCKPLNRSGTLQYNRDGILLPEP
ncbi:PREDICTED: uncharacterized protein LOC104820098 [Tarenaya hassleriana]|uniref:uncharacterized protein LOC104820098 n=1 Tax=Tarenaya hassleriana TaxID=28532 RepID=UPI00053C4885|nr:PREDICTED: uncharacterized protein LOC104820098 [Tarenaya hassleriana]